MPEKNLTDKEKKKIIREARKVNALAYVDEIHNDLVIANIPYNVAFLIVTDVCGREVK